MAAYYFIIVSFCMKFNIRAFNGMNMVLADDKKYVDAVYFRTWRKGCAQCVQRREPRGAADAKSNFTVGENVRRKIGKPIRKSAQM